MGVFPMADGDDGEVRWYEPRRRALFPITGIKLSRSTRKDALQRGLIVRFDTAFEQVIRRCRRPIDNWINEEIIAAFVSVHKDGWAHCCEVWEGAQLVGGIYGLAIGSCFSAESMFHTHQNESKIALWAMIEKCRDLGFTMFDAQVMNPHLESLGAFEISQSKYLDLLADAIHLPTEWSHSQTLQF